MHAIVGGQFSARGEGRVCAVFKRSFYLRAGDRYACVGDASIGRGPLNAIVADFAPPALGDTITLSVESTWQPAMVSTEGFPDFAALRDAALGRVPADGLGCLVTGTDNPLSAHAQPALDALEDWIAGNSLDSSAERLIGLGPGLTPAGDDYLGGVMVALHMLERGAQAGALWQWLEPRLAQRTHPISAAHLGAAAAGEAHEALHHCLSTLFQRNGDWKIALEQLGGVGHGSGWNALAGALAVLRTH
jgi:Protein of unknown function (DUF2877)